MGLGDASGYTIFLRSCKHDQLIKTLTPSTQYLLVKLLRGFCNSLLTSTVLEFPGRVESFFIFPLKLSIVSAYVLNISSPTLWKPTSVEGTVSWTDCCVVTIGNLSYSGAFLVQAELES